MFRTLSGVAKSLSVLPLWSGINTGVFLARTSQWTMEYLARVAVNPYTIAWDQSMFFMEMLMPQLVDSEKPFAFPKEVRAQALEFADRTRHPLDRLSRAHIHTGFHATQPSASQTTQYETPQLTQ